MLIQKLSVRNSRLGKFNSIDIASNSVGYLYCQFLFMTDDWNSALIKVANFSYRGRNYPVLIDDNGLCEVPKEVIKPGRFTVSVYGGGITSTKVTLEVSDSGITPYEDEGISVKYYNEIINKLTATIDELNDTKADNIILDEETNTLQLTSNGAPIGNAVDYASCGIKSFDVDENDNITITLIDGRVINLGQISGASGATFIPHIDDYGVLSWTNNGNLPNPEPVDLRIYDEWVDDDDVATTDYIWIDE